MRVGTKSVLFGVHCFLLHPWFVVAAWWKLYGFPWDPRLWLAFFVHDLGYIGKPNMDGPEGETHPQFGADLMRIFGRQWYEFCLLHSRFYSKRMGLPVSRLCFADKIAFLLTPAWLYLPMARWTGELAEYREGQVVCTPAGEEDSDRVWHANVSAYIRAWVQEHKDGREDTWTRSGEHTLGERDLELLENADVRRRR